MSITQLAETAPPDTGRRPPDVSVFAAVLADTDPDVWAPGLLPGESLDELRARRDAAADFLDELLTGITARAVAG